MWLHTACAPPRSHSTPSPTKNCHPESFSWIYALPKNTVNCFLYTINDITLYLSVYNFFSFNMFPRFIHDDTYCSNLFMLIGIYYFIEGKHFDAFVHFPIISASGWFLFLLQNLLLWLFMYMSQNMYLKVEFVGWSLFLSLTWKVIDKVLSKAFCLFAILHFHEGVPLLPLSNQQWYIF